MEQFVPSPVAATRPPSQPSRMKPFLIFISFLILAGIFAAAWFFIIKNNQGTADVQGESEQTEDSSFYTFKPVDLDAVQGNERIPDIFPAGSPITASSIIQSSVANYNQDGTKLATVVYETSTSPEEVFASFEDYFQKNGYAVLADKKTENSVDASNEKGDRMRVTVFEAEEGYRVAVTHRSK